MTKGVAARPLPAARAAPGGRGGGGSPRGGGRGEAAAGGEGGAGAEEVRALLAVAEEEDGEPRPIAHEGPQGGLSREHSQGREHPRRQEPPEAAAPRAQ